MGDWGSTEAWRLHSCVQNTIMCCIGSQHMFKMIPSTLYPHLIHSPPCPIPPPCVTAEADGDCDSHQHALRGAIARYLSLLRASIVGITLRLLWQKPKSAAAPSSTSCSAVVAVREMSFWSPILTCARAIIDSASWRGFPIIKRGTSFEENLALRQIERAQVITLLQRRVSHPLMRGWSR